MKLGELKYMGKQDTKIYYALIRFLMFGSFWVNYKSFGIIADELDELTIKDIFDLYTEEEILTGRNIGFKSIERLKELV